eukprot:5173700-Prymnesium_polylepis.1
MHGGAGHAAGETSIVAPGFENSTMPGWGGSVWYGRCTLGGGGRFRGLGGFRWSGVNLVAFAKA